MTTATPKPDDYDPIRDLEEIEKAFAGMDARADARSAAEKKVLGPLGLDDVMNPVWIDRDMVALIFERPMRIPFSVFLSFHSSLSYINEQQDMNECQVFRIKKAPRKRSSIQLDHSRSEVVILRRSTVGFPESTTLAAMIRDKIGA